jgi:outer membrane receptor protein involved in Fe transport
VVGAGISTVPWTLVVRETARAPLLWITVLLCAGPPAAAQSAGGLRGVVLDNGTPVAGASVAVVNPDVAVNRGAVTDANGEWRVVPLPPAKGYSLRVSFPGMVTMTLTDIDVVAGQIAALPITLGPEGEMTEKVRVVGRPDIVNPDVATTQTSFSAEFIDGLPILGRNYQDILSLAPGVSDVDGDGNPNIHGARDTDVVTLVDGVSTGDPLTGKFGQRFNLEAIQEIEVKTAGAGAEFSRAQGGFVTVHTKSGGNEFEGKFSFHWRSHLLDGDGAGTDDPALHGGATGGRILRFNDYQPFLSLSGPIHKDRAWYYVTSEYIQREEPINAVTRAFVRTEKQKRLFGKVSWDISTNHTLVFTATRDPQEYDNLGVGSFTPLEAGYTFKLGGTNLVLKERTIFSPNLFLETTAQRFTSNPTTIPTVDPDTNGNGIFFIDRNDNERWEATETDPGEDWDRDGNWDVFERDPNRNNRVDDGEQEYDIDGDRHYTPRRYGCEGATREDEDCDGHLDDRIEDLNGDGILQFQEDRDGDRRLDDGTEDRNRNGVLDDRPFPSSVDLVYDYRSTPRQRLPPFYPYESYGPIPGDRDSRIDPPLASGANPTDFNRETGRITLRQDLTAFVPEWRGQHELKVGAVVEQESFSQRTRIRPILIAQRLRLGPPISYSAVLPAEPDVSNQAENMTVGIYLQDTYKPLPNLTLGLGLRFDREATDAFGYSFFEPADQRRLFDRLRNLGGKEINDQLIGDGDGVLSQGFCSDPIFAGVDCATNAQKDPVIKELHNLGRIATARLSQHHTSTIAVAKSLELLFPEAIVTDPDTGEKFLDREILREQGSATFQEREAFRLTNSNLAPRLFLSWDPWSDSRTKIFINWSRFYDKLFLGTVVPEQGPDDVFRSYFPDPDGLTDGGVPNNGLGQVISKSTPSGHQVDRGLQTPFSDELTAGFEREIAPEVALRITYISRKYRQQLQDIDVNHSLRFDAQGNPLDVLGQILAVDAPQSRGASARLSDGRPDLFIHNYFFNQIFRVGNFNEARYRALELQLTRRLSRRWQLDGSYTYSRALGAAESFRSDLGTDPSTTESEFGYLDYDQRHVVKVNLMTFLPGDWRLGSTLSWGSGLPFSIVDEFLAYDSIDFAQFRRRYVRLHRNTERNHAFYNIDVRAEKALVLDRLNSKLYLTVDNLLNTDDLTVYALRSEAVDASRRFGRRFQVGFQIEF